MGEGRPTTAELRAEILRLRTRVAELEAEHGVVTTPPDRLTTARVPDDVAPVFLRAQDYVSRYFARLDRDPERSSISISGERYVLVRAASLSVEFFELVASLYKDRDPAEGRSVARQLLFDVAYALGKADAKAFVAATGVTDPIDKLSAGPVHFSFAGWAFVDIKPESKPRPDEQFCLVYEHPFSFESDSWLKQGRAADSPVCIMNAGYSSGWCSESFGQALVSAEVDCRASEGQSCSFIMAPPDRIEGHVASYHVKHASRPDRVRLQAIPDFFLGLILEGTHARAFAGLAPVEVGDRLHFDLEVKQPGIEAGVLEVLAAYPGRVGGGFASGAFPADFEIVGVPHEEITARFKEALPKVVAALRGQDPTQLGGDRALQACATDPVPVVVAAQSLPAVRRAAGLGIGILYDSLQTTEHSRKLSDAYDEAGGEAAKILIRRVWIGDPPEESAAAQMAAFRAVSTERVAKNWGDDDQLVIGADGIRIMGGIRIRF